jgi:Rod binding domain-containing protein
VRLTEEKRKREEGEQAVISAQVGQKLKTESNPKGAGRSESGDSLAARTLGVTRQQVERSNAIAGISPEAKEAARAAGIDGNQSALLKRSRGLAAHAERNPSPIGHAL